MLVQSKPLVKGTKAPDFNLLDTVSDKMISLQDVKGEKGTVVMFICNHCPFVIHVNPEISQLGLEYQKKGIRFIAHNLPFKGLFHKFNHRAVFV